MIDLLASEGHFLDHLAPIFLALPEERRGIVHTPPGLVERATALGLPEPRWLLKGETLEAGPPVLVASHGDYKRAGQRPIVLGEHGAGQSYSHAHPSYAGGGGRGRAVLFLCPNHQAARRNRRRYPKIPVAVVGMPVMDRLRHAPGPTGKKVAVSFHWRCKVAPEADTALDHFLPVLYTTAVALAVEGYELVGHAHPRIAAEASRRYREAGIPFAASFEEVVTEAAVFAVDNSSTLYQFAALDRPVVVLNSPRYRRNVNHGLRFWDEAGVGLNVSRPRDLCRSILAALEDPPEVRDRRRESVGRVVPFCDGSSASRAAEAVMALLG